MKYLKHQKRWANGALFMAALIWGSGFIVMKNALVAIEPFTLIAIRFSAAAVVLALIYAPRLKNLTGSCVWRGLIVGTVMFAAYIVQTFGLAHTTPGKNAFLTTAYCVIVPFMYWLLDRRRPDRYNLVAALFMVAGVGLVSLTEALTVGWGDALSVGSGALYALQIALVAKLARSEDTLLFTLVQFAACAVLGWAGAFVWARDGLKAALPLIGDAAGSLAYLAIVCTALALFLQNIGQKYTNPSAASIIMGLEAVFGVIFSIIFYGEVITPRLLAGFALIFVAVLTSELKPWQSRVVLEG